MKNVIKKNTQIGYELSITGKSICTSSSSPSMHIKESNNGDKRNIQTKPNPMPQFPP
jgi:hypothetical protein